MHIFGNRSTPTSFGASDFLRKDVKMASLLPAALRMANLQTDCARILPAMFASVDILQYQNGELVLGVPNSALAAKLKQQLPKLQGALELAGWRIDQIRLKMAMNRAVSETPVVLRTLHMPDSAVAAFDDLRAALPDSAENSPLIAALSAMIARRRGR